MADEFGTDFIAETPDHPVDALLGADVVAGEQEDEIVGYIEAFDMQPHAAVGNIGDQAVARQGAAAELDLCHPVDLAAPRPAALVHGRQAFGLQRVHAHGLFVLRSRASFGDSPGYPRKMRSSRQLRRR